MSPEFLVPEITVSGNGESFPADLSDKRDLLLLTLGIEHVVEQESLLVGIYGSSDGKSWDTEPILEFPQRFYRGVSAVLLDASGLQGYQFIRAQWKVNRWGRGDKIASFRFYIFAEAAGGNSMATG